MAIPCSDRQLIRRIEDGDEEAIGLLFDAYSKVVYSIALCVLGHLEAAEDVLHETFMTLWREPDRFAVRDGRLQSSLAISAYKRALDVRAKEARLHPDSDRTLAAVARGVS